MKTNNGFLLIDAMLSLSITSLICMMLIPMLQTMGQHYELAYNEVQLYRAMYVYVKSGQEVLDDGQKICSKTFCIPKK